MVKLVLPSAVSIELFSIIAIPILMEYSNSSRSILKHSFESRRVFQTIIQVAIYVIIINMQGASLCKVWEGPKDRSPISIYD